MTLTEDEYEAIAEVFTRIKGAVTDDTEHDDTYALKIFREALEKPGGSIDAIGHPEVYKLDVDSVYDWPDHYDQQYGIDASTTRSEELSNGVVLDVANAKLMTSGENGDSDVEYESTIVASLFTEDDAFPLPTERVLREGGPIRTELYTFKESEGRDDLKSWASSVALSLAEGYHGKRLTPVNGPLLRDGPLYPMGLVSRVVFERGDNRKGSDSYRLPDSYQMKYAKEAVQAYIDTITKQIDVGYPVVGVTKTFITSMLIDAIERKFTESDESVPKLPWRNDYSFVSSLLYTGEPQTVTFTSWFVETYREVNNNHLEPLESFEFSGDYTPQDFRRAFFYVRLPNDGPVFRIETPFTVINNDEEMADKIQQMVLKEVVIANDIPYVVKRADDRANITQENSEALKSLLREQLTNDYNIHGRGKNRRYHSGGNEHHE